MRRDLSIAVSVPLALLNVGMLVLNSASHSWVPVAVGLVGVAACHIVLYIVGRRHGMEEAMKEYDAVYRRARTTS